MQNKHRSMNWFIPTRWWIATSSIFVKNTRNRSIVWRVFHRTFIIFLQYTSLHIHHKMVTKLKINKLPCQVTMTNTQIRVLKRLQLICEANCDGISVILLSSTRIYNRAKIEKLKWIIITLDNLWIIEYLYHWKRSTIGKCCNCLWNRFHAPSSGKAIVIWTEENGVGISRNENAPFDFISYLGGHAVQKIYILQNQFTCYLSRIERA